MSPYIVEMSNENNKLMVQLKTLETPIMSSIFDRNLIHIIIFNLTPIEFFLNGFWRSKPSMNCFILKCISCNRKRKAKSSPKNRVQYISVVSPSPQLTSTSSSSSSPATTSSSVSSTSSHTLTSVRMAPNDTSSPVASEPSAPSPGLVLFNSEEQSDIVFLVGIDPEPIWRFPAHSFIVVNASPMLKAIVESGEITNDKQQNKRINWCKAEIFHVILRYIYTNEITIQSVPNALVLFTAANQFLLNDLCRLCLTFLFDNCNEENVLEILSHFSQFSYLRPSSLTPDIGDLNGSTGSPAMVKQSVLQCSNNCDNILNELITRCYYTLDRESTKILASEAFCVLEHDLIVKILSRDSLNIASETEVFESMKRWSCRQCKKECKELSAHNKREVLGKALYCTRYLTMTSDEFTRGPYMSDLLTEEEKRPLLARLSGDSQAQLPVHLTGRKLDVRRKFVEPLKRSIDELASTSNSGSNPLSNAGIITKKKSTSKKLLNGLGDLVICVIRLLD